jgi:NAD(P)-dependent dehydrogenase (short-subunit alcohol dehydrogenase family)
MHALADLHIVVTGGTGALGVAVVGQLLAAGAIAHVPALTAADAAHFAHRQHERVRLVESLDLSDEQTAVSFYASFTREQPLWASLHIAGGFDMGPIEQTSRAAWMHMIDMNATSCFLCCREAVRAMKRAGRGGRIVNIAARPALRPEQGARMVPYTASKSAVAALTAALAAEVAADGILVNAVAPSIIDTPANRAAMPDADHARWPRPEQIAAAILWLASPDNTLTSGTVVPVYGRA